MVAFWWLFCDGFLGLGIFFSLWFLFVCLHFCFILLVWFFFFFQRLKPEELCDMHDLPGR